MKKNRFLALILAAVLLLPLLNIPKVSAADASVTSGCHSVDAAYPLSGTKKLLDTSEAVFLFDRKSKTLIYAYEPDKPIDPSSMAKLMTALLVIEKADLTQYTSVSNHALASVGVGVTSVKPRFKAGEELTVESLLYCMMVASDNDSAAVLAETVAGSQEKFVQWMNEKAQELGCTKTYFTNPHGLYDVNAHSTVRDICRILDAALDNEMFRTLFTTKNYTVPETNIQEARYIVTTNDMMTKESTSRYFDERVTGGKTGASKNGRCLAVTAEDNDMELLGIVMGAKNVVNEDDPTILDTVGSFGEMKVLLDHASDKYGCRQVFYIGQTFSQYPVENGANHAVSTPESAVYTVLPLEFSSDQIRWVYGSEKTDLKAPLEAGHLISYVEAWYGGLCVAHTNLVAMHDVAVYQAPPVPPAAAQVQEDDGGAMLAIVFGVILGVAVLVLVGTLVLQLIRRANMRNRRRRRRRRTNR